LAKVVVTMRTAQHLYGVVLPVMAPKAALRHLAHLQARSTMHITAAVLRCAATPQANYGAMQRCLAAIAAVTMH
jgi:hypothetical protein